jgi:hypothetical protein
MKKLLTEWRKFLNEQPYKNPGQLYVGLMLDDDSKKEVMAAVGKIPKGWTPRGTHMTVTYTSTGVPHRYMGEATAKVVGLAQNDRVWALRVKTDIPTKNEIPHITVATAPGVSAKESNEFSLEDFKPIPEFETKGDVAQKFSDTLKPKMPRIE